MILLSAFIMTLWSPKSQITITLHARYLRIMTWDIGREKGEGITEALQFLWNNKGEIVDEDV